MRCGRFRVVGVIDLYPHQQRMLADFAGHLRAGRRRLLGVAPTGSGKGTLAAHALASAEAKGNRAVFVSHLREINRDVVERIRAAGVSRVAVAMGDHDAGDADALVTVCSVQTARARGLYLDARLVIWDECHRTASPTYVEVQQQCAPDAVHVGFTATPARADDRALPFFDVIVQGPQPAELVALGLLAPIAVFAPASHRRELAADPVTAYPGDQPGIVFCTSVDHSRDVADGLVRRGLRAAHVDGKSPNRDELIADFNAGRLDVLTNYRLFTEGVDLPRAEVCMLAGTVTATGAFLQSIGRVRRVHPGKTHAVLHDLCGSTWLHGSPDADRTYHLHGKAIRVAEQLPSAVQCPSCLSWGPGSTVCVACGAERPPAPPPRIKRAPLEQVADQLGEDRRQSLLLRWVRERGPRQAAAIYRRVFKHYPPAGWIESACRQHQGAA